MDTDVRGFELWLRAGGYRPDTISRAVRIATNYLTWSLGATMDPATRGSAVGYMAAANGRGISRMTLLNYYKDLRLFFRFAVSEGLADCDPFADVPRPKPSLEEREKDTRFLPYTEADMQSLLEATPFWTWLGLRDRALIWVFWDTPLRVSEVVKLDQEDVDFVIQEITVKDGKGGARYEGLITSRAALAVHRYLQERPHDSPRVFVDRYGGPLTRHAVAQMLRRLARRAGWKKPCSPHCFRHNWRARMRMLGLDDTAISAMMGHATVVVTQGYARRVARQMAKAQLRQLLAG